jgi:hypothetical protein
MQLEHVPLDPSLFSSHIAPVEGEGPSVPPPDYTGMVLNGEPLLSPLPQMPMLVDESNPLRLGRKEGGRERGQQPAAAPSPDPVAGTPLQANLVWLDTGDAYLFGEPITLSKEDLDKVRALVAEALATKHRERAERLASIYGPMHESKQRKVAVQKRRYTRKAVRRVPGPLHPTEETAGQGA